MKDRAMRRKSDFTHAIRKKKKSDWEEHKTIPVDNRTSTTACFDGTVVKGSWYDNLHQYSKNKIHCSCPMCNAKSGVNNDIRNYPHSDQKKFECINQQIEESFTEEVG